MNAVLKIMLCFLREAFILLFHKSVFKNPDVSLLYSIRQKKGSLAQKHWAGPANMVKCKPCPTMHASPVCGSDGHTYTSKVSSASTLQTFQLWLLRLGYKDVVVLANRQC